MSIRIDEKYSRMSKDELVRRITERKRQLGDAVCILAHHYQRDEVFQFADYTGDSLKLARQAAASGAKYIVFCGVYFMAESADILTGNDTAVILPELSAGCALADFALPEDVARAIKRITAAVGENAVVPIAYINSFAAVKAIVGKAGGACCTSSNAKNVCQWALSDKASDGAGADKIFFLPDKHLGVNTAVAMGFKPDDCVRYDPSLDDGGLTDEQIRSCKFILWNGECYVHQVFTVEQVERARRDNEGIKIIVHPECPHEVVSSADLAGSTEQIIRAVEDSPAGSCWAIGTEVNMVSRLARNHPDKHIQLLSDTPAECLTMAKIDLPHLLWVLDNLVEGRVVNRVSVEADIASDARIALERMVATKPQAGASAADK